MLTKLAEHVGEVIWLWGKDKFVAGKVGVSYVFFSHIPLAPQKAFYNYILKKFVSEFLRKKC